MIRRNEVGVSPAGDGVAETGGEQPRLAIVTCMDGRLDAAGFFELWAAPVHVIRNAGGRVTPDVLRSLAVSCTMQIEQILIVHHTQCAMAENTDEDIHKLLPPGVEPDMEFLTIGDHPQTLRRDVLTVRDCPLVPAGIQVTGLIYDLESRTPHQIEVESEGHISHPGDRIP